VSADSPLPIDVRAEMRSAAAWLAAGGAAPNGRAVTSDLTIDEALLLHSIGWEPVELVFGVSVTSVPVGVWTWGRGEIGAASDAHNLAVHTAAERLGRECAKAGGHGVVGVQVSVEVNPHHVDVHLVGTAVRPVEGKKPGQTFVSDLSARDFVLLSNAGWSPLGLSFGASFIYAPRRDAATAIRQSSQNIELTNLTEALYSARESAMERMQASGLGHGGPRCHRGEDHRGPDTIRPPRHRVHRLGNGGSSRRGQPCVPEARHGPAARRRRRSVRSSVFEGSLASSSALANADCATRG
jgi:uncharacterized protein YbjQ (UPF0145 family)